MIRPLVVAALAVLPLAACGGSGGHVAAPDPSGARRTITVTSPAFADGARIPDRYTCHGDGVSPPLSWSGAPSESSLVLVVDDPDAPGRDYLHWVVTGLGGSTGGVGTGAPPPGAQELAGTGGPGWTAPCPPSGTHHYRFTVYALRSDVASPAPGQVPEFLAAVAHDAVAWGRLTGTVSAR